jgi:ABC-type multidrug transport system ATPase subunit/ABC-type transport system involved in multi-copper enzyme maturation permease subunit
MLWPARIPTVTAADTTPVRTTRGVEIAARDLWRSVKGGRNVLCGVSLTIRPRELVAVVGGSGAGKTTLLEALAGVRPAQRGSVRFNGVDLYGNLDAFRRLLGYVPQDDIIHADLPLERTLRYAAALRLPPSTSAVEVDAAVEQALGSLGLAERADVQVGALSGGQRKRASIAVELLTSPDVFFLDEPTSGLDPASAGELLTLLRGLADGGSTVVFTTHSVQDLQSCDRVVFLARDGHLAFDGTIPEALAYFGVDRIEEIYGLLEWESTPEAWAQRFTEHRSDGTDAAGDGAVQAPAPRERIGFWAEWSVLTRRTLETLVRNRLTLAILLGSPALIVAMFAVLFRPGAFDFHHPIPSSIQMIVFWITFAAFFFGLTYGLLQIVTEQAILRREALVGQRLSAYLLSKIAVLLPFLVFVIVLMLVVLRALDRMPAASTTTYVGVGVTLSLLAASALTLGLMTSAAVSNPAQATLALPMLCFPAVLFSGAILPVHVMAGAGAALSTIISDRWAFEALGHDLGIRHILSDGGSSLGPPLLDAYGDAGTRATGFYWLLLAAFTIVFFVGAWLILRRRTRTATR